MLKRVQVIRDKSSPVYTAYAMRRAFIFRGISVPFGGYHVRKQNHDDHIEL